MLYDILWVFVLFPLDEQVLQVIINYDYVIMQAYLFRGILWFSTIKGVVL